MNRNLSETYRLPEKWSVYLAAQPETGMGYQTGDVVLINGSVVKDVAFVGATYIAEVKNRDDVPFAPADIAEIRLTHTRWGFRK